MAIDIKSILKQIAPAIASLWGGPAAGIAVKALSQALFGKDDAKSAEIEAAILSATPEQLLAIKTADQQFQVKMEEIGLEWGKLEVEDKKSARDLFKVNIWPQITISSVYIIGYFWILRMLLLGEINPSPGVLEMVKSLISTLGAVVLMIMTFWFGSSFGSARKSNMLALSSPTFNGNGK